MAKRSRILVIALAVVLVIGLAGTGIALAKGRLESGGPSASYAVPYSGLSEKSESSNPQMMGRGGMRGGPGVGISNAITLNRIATFLGITPEELKTQLAGGKSLLQLAIDNNKTAKDLVTTILAPWKEHLQIDAKYGYVSQAEADALYQLRAVRTEASLSRTMPARGAAPGAPRGMGFRGVPGRGMMGGGQAGANTQ